VVDIPKVHQYVRDLVGAEQPTGLGAEEYGLTAPASAAQQTVPCVD
jgi:hypothetical protein